MNIVDCFDKENRQKYIHRELASEIRYQRKKSLNPETKTKKQTRIGDGLKIETVYFRILKTCVMSIKYFECFIT